MGATAVIIADTNVLLRAALNDDPAQLATARAYLAGAETIVIPAQVICEFVWVMTRSYRLSVGVVGAAVHHLLEDPRVRCENDLALAGLSFLDAGGDFADGVIECEGRRLGGTVLPPSIARRRRSLAGRVANVSCWVRRKPVIMAALSSLAMRTFFMPERRVITRRCRWPTKHG